MRRIDFEKIKKVKYEFKYYNSFTYWCFYRAFNIQIYFDYKKHPDLYEIQSAPWYMSIQIYGLGAGIVIFIAIILKFLIKKKLKNN